MKQIESKQRKHSVTHLVPLLALTLVGVLAMTLSTASLACHKGKPHGKDAPATCDDSGGGGDTGTTEGPDPSKLVRASFETFGGIGDGNGGISADGLDTCRISRNGQDVTYDYWAWQERLLSNADSMLDDGYDKNNVLGCQSFENRSDVSGGGRWFLMTSAGEVRQDKVVRWLVVDFSDMLGLSECPDLDGVGNSNLGIDPIYSSSNDYPHNGTNANLCVDNLTVWLKADRIMKNSANFQQLEISIRYRPNGSDYWIPWGSIEHVNPLYLRDPMVGSPFEGRDCRVMSTRPSPNEDHDRQLAELTVDLGPGNNVVIGRYHLPMEVCVIKASD